MKKILIAGALLVSLLTGAEEIFAGAIALSDAALSLKAPKIAHFDAAFFPSLPEGRAYATVTLDVPATRKISIFDYQLEIFGRSYECVALRPADGKWATVVDPQAGGKKYGLLFILDRDAVSNGGSVEAMLKNSGSQLKTKITLKNLRDQAF